MLYPLPQMRIQVFLYLTFAALQPEWKSCHRRIRMTICICVVGEIGMLKWEHARSAWQWALAFNLWSLYLGGGMVKLKSSLCLNFYPISDNGLSYQAVSCSEGACLQNSWEFHLCSSIEWEIFCSAWWNIVLMFLPAATVTSGKSHFGFQSAPWLGKAAG